MSRSGVANPVYLDEVLPGRFPRSFHLEMIKDTERVSQVKAAIASFRTSGDVFCELGCGSGIFSIYACQFFDRVLAFEADEEILDFAKHMARTHGLDQKIEFFQMDVTKPEAPQAVSGISVLFGELLSIWLIEEQQVAAFNNFREHLQGACHFIPQKVFNLLSAGHQVYDVDGFVLKAPVGEFALPSRPRIVTETVLAEVVDFARIADPEVQGSVKLRSFFHETLNCVRLNSYVEFAKSVNFSTTDSLMPTTVVPTRNQIEVEPRQEFAVDFKFTRGARLEAAEFRFRV
jgi:predicted RNA methylase